MLGKNNQNERPAGVGIVAVEAYVPKRFVSQADLEEFDGVSQGKYTIGLGQTKMAVLDDRQDINSICLSAVSSLMKKYDISYRDVGRLEVGTETIIDKSKSVKTVLMQLFKDSGNSDVQGVDTTNACYGGTNALFNAINWMESSYWDGRYLSANALRQSQRYALVVAADIAVYKSGPARPTGGAGAIAMLIGPNAPLVFDQGLRSTYMDHVYDFYKPDLHSEFPIVDGPLSTTCYTTAVDKVFNLFIKKAEQVLEKDNLTMDSLADFYLFHSPYTKLVQKSYARLAFNDFINSPASENGDDKDLAWVRDLDYPATLTNRDLEKAFVARTKKSFEEKVVPGLLLPKNLGNSYCASLYSGLVSLISNVSSDGLVGKRLVLFSYGSGLASSMFSIKCVAPPTLMRENLNLDSRLESRIKISPQEYDEIMSLREKTHNMRDYDPVGQVVDDDGTFFLNRVDDKFRRSYSVIGQ
ncbi:MAG: hypothetical protein SGCHY_001317 [Lobulomycetales sp.]